MTQDRERPDETQANDALLDRLRASDPIPPTTAVDPATSARAQSLEEQIMKSPILAREPEFVAALLPAVVPLVSSSRQ